jgi:hypothetical protein
MNQNQEHVLVPASDTAPGVVMVIWTDEQETPLEAIGRLNQEVADISGSQLANAQRALSEVQDALSSVEQAESSLSTAQDELEQIDGI